MPKLPTEQEYKRRYPGGTNYPGYRRKWLEADSKLRKKGRDRCEAK
jgi:hypothetical protein